VKRALALAAIVVAGTVTYGELGGLLKGPSVFADELIYMDATRSVADGHRPMERDQPYGRGLLFPFAAAPVVALAPNQLDAYRGLKWFNAFVFSLAAVPAFFLARRFLSEGWSLLVAALTAAGLRIRREPRIPSRSIIRAYRARSIGVVSSPPHGAPSCRQ